MPAGGATAANPRSLTSFVASTSPAPAACGGVSHAFIGPGYLVAVGYMDPGNWATSIAGGAQFGYTLLVVALMSNIMAIILQSLCARLAIGSGRDLAQACRDAFPRPVAWMLWLFAEIAIIATDIAEVVGTAIGLNLLFGIPLETRRRHHRARCVPNPLAAKIGLPLDRSLRHLRCSASSSSASSSRSPWPIPIGAA